MSNKRMTPEQEKFITDNFQSMTTKEMVIELGNFSEGGIDHFKRVNRLRKQRRRSVILEIHPKGIFNVLAKENWVA